MKIGEIDIDNLFDSARHESPKIEFNEVKQDFIKTVGNVNINSTIKHKLTIKNITIMLSTITLITAAIITLTRTKTDDALTTTNNKTYQIESKKSIQTKGVNEIGTIDNLTPNQKK
jgi:hypothetical protein